jgi:hypothetical protein
VPPSLARRALDAAVRPLHLVAPGFGVAAAGGLVALGAAPFAIAVGALSLGAWGALVAWDLATPPKVPDPTERIASEELREHLRAVIAAGERVRAHLDAHDGSFGPSLAEIRAESDELVDAALAAATRADAVARLLATVDAHALVQEGESRGAAAKKARDPEVKQALKRAAEAKARELKGWRELAGVVQRVTAELVAAEAALDELLVRVVRVTVDDPGAGAGEAVRGEIKDLAARLHVLERAAETTLREVG